MSALEHNEVHTRENSEGCIDSRLAHGLLQPSGLHGSELDLCAQVALMFDGTA